jgi:predicted permease
MRDSRFAPEVLSLRDAVVGDVKHALWILFAAAGVVLLIACGNLANLFLVRAQDRWHELQVRMALGAESRQLLGHALAEALLISLVAGALGIYVADTALRGLLGWEALPLPRLERIGFGWRTAFFSAALSIVTGIALGLVPMIRMRRVRSVHAQLHRGLTASRDAVRARNGLVVAQVALAVVLLAAGGLMARSYQNLSHVAPGFDSAGVLAASVSLPSGRFPTHQDASRFYETLIERVRALPGVVSAGATSALPLAGAGGCAALFVEDAPVRPNENPPCVPVRRVTPGYFQTLGIPVHGTTPSWLDVNAESAGVVVTRALAERLWPGQEAIGKGIRGNGWVRPFYRVVGVAGNVREAGLDKPPIEAAYFPLIPMEGAPLWAPARAMTLVVRTQSEDPTGLAGALRGVLNELDRSVPLGNVTTMARIVEQSMSRTTLVLLLLGIAAGLGLLLATIGLYGVLAYTVSHKRREIGIRTALGGARGQIAGLIVHQSLALTGIGIAAGIAVAALTTSVLENLLFGISAVDPLTFAAASVLLVATSLMASYIPARRAASVDPMLVLRTD